jgi:hypothetical protein
MGLVLGRENPPYRARLELELERLTVGERPVDRGVRATVPRRERVPSEPRSTVPVRVGVVLVVMLRVGAVRTTELERGGEVRTTGARGDAERLTVRVPAAGTRETPTVRVGARETVLERAGTERRADGTRFTATGDRPRGTGRATVDRYGARWMGTAR